MWNAIKGFLRSKKFIAMLAGLIVAVGAKRGLNLDPVTINQVVTLIIAYIVGQGIADNGKAAAKIAGTVEMATSGTHLVQAVRDKLR